MTPDLHTIEIMLKRFARELSAKIGERALALVGTPKPTNDTDAQQLEEEFNRLRGMVAYHERAEAEWLALARQRTGDPLKLFAGIWPPSAPLDLLAMRTTLLEDFDELGAAGCDYLGDGDDFGEGFGPMGSAFAEVNSALQSLTPDSPEAATAIHYAWRADEELGFGGEWRLERVARAGELAMTALPRPR